LGFEPTAEEIKGWLNELAVLWECKLEISPYKHDDDPSINKTARMVFLSPAEHQPYDGIGAALFGTENHDEDRLLIEMFSYFLTPNYKYIDLPQMRNRKVVSTFFGT